MHDAFAGVGAQAGIVVTDTTSERPTAGLVVWSATPGPILLTGKPPSAWTRRWPVPIALPLALI